MGSNPLGLHVLTSVMPTAVPSDDRRIIRVGSRRSQLALVQTNLAVQLLKGKNPGLEFKVVEISTVGDKVLNVALSKIGDKGLFTKELENALFDREVDFVVHSLKDVSTSLPSGLVLGCIFDRTTPEDVVLMSSKYRGLKLDELPDGSVIGTSALRRVATLSRLYPHLKFVSIRGNLNTRLRKLDEGHQNGKDVGADLSIPVINYDALILARAGVERLGWSDRIDQVLTDCMHAVGQGALACECRQDDTAILSILSSLHSESVALSTIAERSLMRRLDGGCSTPIGVRCVLTEGRPWSSLQLSANILSLDGSQCVEGCLSTKLLCHPKESEDECSLANSLGAVELPESAPKNDQHSVPEMRPVVTDDELLMAKDHSSTFTGIFINPSSPDARLRMARAQSLGRTLAEQLLSKGGAQLLSEIRAQSAIKSQPTVNSSTSSILLPSVS
ncbi:unnamed protein product [Calicophoron daubneyi]|uniref:hydroxymethylbilane synthase n=1 Tax=Calicophoron daubneyi TaxID=300641 RepID=A0AAV2TS13_CALDB